MEKEKAKKPTRLGMTNYGNDDQDKEEQYDEVVEMPDDVWEEMSSQLFQKTWEKFIESNKKIAENLDKINKSLEDINQKLIIILEEH